MEEYPLASRFTMIVAKLITITIYRQLSKEYVSKLRVRIKKMGWTNGNK